MEDRNGRNLMAFLSTLHVYLLFPSVTRCVCGSNVDEEGEFMVQCETCDVWQYGLCVGYEDEGNALHQRNAIETGTNTLRGCRF